MAKLALNFICKNEAHVVERMLNSVKDITDCIVVCDTGSTDGTQEIIKNFGKSNNIETHVIDRPFDNFENSRNAAMKYLMDLKQKSNDWWGYWIDCDEIMEIDKGFIKNNINKDLYMINTYINNMKYTRNTFFRLSKYFRWYGPCHEFIVCDDKNITSGLMDGLTVRVYMDGASWKSEETNKKYKSHATILENYIDYTDRNSRWIFYTAQSYHDSATIPNNKPENDERLRRSVKYYQERVERVDGYEEERFYSQYRIGVIKRTLDFPWYEVHQELLKAYNMDPMRGEPIKAIIDHYQQMGEWNMAYLYSKFGKSNFHGNSPYPKKLLFVDESLYNWRFLEAHAASSLYVGKRNEAKDSFVELVDMIRKKPQLFPDNEVERIMSNAALFNSL
jgi:glycosyltransferase involved in cell wall biosynthesis